MHIHELVALPEKESSFATLIPFFVLHVLFILLVNITNNEQVYVVATFFLVSRLLDNLFWSRAIQWILLIKSDKLFVAGCIIAFFLAMWLMTVVTVIFPDNKVLSMLFVLIHSVVLLLPTGIILAYAVYFYGQKILRRNS